MLAKKRKALADFEMVAKWRKESSSTVGAARDSARDPPPNEDHTGTEKSEEFEPVPIVEPDNDLQHSFEYDFIDVAIRRRLGRETLNDFLAVFRKHGIGNFPSDSRTAVGSLRHVHVEQMCQGQYYHFGVLISV